MPKGRRANNNGGEVLAKLKRVKLADERTGWIWFFRIASVIAMLALIAAIVVFARKGNTMATSLLLIASPAFAVAVAWCWTGWLFAPFEWAKRYVDGAEGDHRHEWYSFRGQRVRVFIDENQQPWFALNEIAFILAFKSDPHAFRHYGPQEYGIPEPASEPCLSETGLRRLIKYSTHPDAGALGIWLERDVLRMLRNRKVIPEKDAAA